MGVSEKDIKKNAKGATVRSGLSISGSRAAESKGQVQSWLSDNGLL